MMKFRPVQYIVWAVAAIPIALLVACSDSNGGGLSGLGPGAQSTTTPSVVAPTSEATASATTAPETPTRAPETPTTEAPTATPTPEDDCPIEAAICNIAESLSVALEEGNYGAIVDLVQGRQETCPGGEPLGAGGPFPLCDGAAAGEMRTGYQMSRRYSEGFVGSAEHVVAFLQGFADAASPGSSDAYGSGELRLQAVSCVEPAGAACNLATVIFTAILDGTHREVLSFSIPLPVNPDTPINHLRNGVVLPDEEAALFETGGEVFGFGQVYQLD
jgi:hypothetical protein